MAKQVVGCILCIVLVVPLALGEFLRVVCYLAPAFCQRRMLEDDPTLAFYNIQHESPKPKGQGHFCQDAFRENNIS